MKNMLRSMIDRFIGANEPAEQKEEEEKVDMANSLPYTIPANVPVVGMLIVPKHDQNRFYTILEVSLDKVEENSPVTASPRVRLKILKCDDNKKLDTVWFKDPTLFWKYYDRKDEV